MDRSKPAQAKLSSKMPPKVLATSNLRFHFLFRETCMEVENACMKILIKLMRMPKNVDEPSSMSSVGMMNHWRERMALSGVRLKRFPRLDREPHWIGSHKNATA